MDARLTLINGARPSPLRRDDLPLVAKALVSFSRHHAKAGVGKVRNIRYTRIWSHDFDVVILKDDWDKIEVLVREEVFNPNLTITGQAGKYLDPKVHYDEPVVDINDRPFYQHVLQKLQLIFTDSYPTHP